MLPTLYAQKIVQIDSQACCSASTPNNTSMQSDVTNITSYNSTVLIVDDQPAIRRIMSRILEAEGYRIYTAANGQEALQVASEIMPDVILLDVLMPNGMSGFEVCRRLRQTPFLNDVPILMVTALDDRESRLEGIQSGADDFIVKPFDPVELQARVKNITRLNRYRRLLVERLKFEWVVEESEEGYVIMDENDLIVYANSRAKLFLNLTHTPRIETHDNFLDIAKRQYNCEPTDAWDEWPQVLAERDNVTRYLIRPESEYTSAFWLKVTALKLPLGSETLYAVRLRDVTQQMSSRHTVWQLHAMIFHKLRTPFSSVFMSLELLNAYRDELPKEEVDMLYSTALTQANRLNQVMNGMLAYIDSTSSVAPLNNFELGQMTAVVQKLGEVLEINKLDCRIAPDLVNSQIKFNEDTVSTIMWEVVRNAQKFHPLQDPQIDIVLKKHDPNNVAIQIIDNGITLSPNQLVSVWQPYYQAEKSFTGEVPGAGLGLTAVALLVWQIGGHYRIYNRQNETGVVVELILPLLHTNE